MKEQVNIRYYKISYYYLATGMEGRADEYPEQIIMATDKDMAIYVYMIIHGMYLEASLNEFRKLPEYEKTWGITISEIHSPLENN